MGWGGVIDRGRDVGVRLWLVLVPKEPVSGGDSVMWFSLRCQHRWKERRKEWDPTEEPSQSV